MDSSIAELNKELKYETVEWMTWGDTYVIECGTQDPVLALCILLVIDASIEQENQVAAMS